MTAIAITNENTVNTAASNSNINKRANAELEHASSQNTDSNTAGGRKKSIRVEDPQTVARRAELVARISAIDEMVAKLQNTPETCDIYRHGLTSIEARCSQKMKAAEYRVGAVKKSIESSYSNTLSQLAKAEKREFVAHSAMLYTGLAKSHQKAVMYCD